MLADSVELYNKIKSMNELLWENRANRPTVDRWLDNFIGKSAVESVERIHAPLPSLQVPLFW